MAFATFTDLQQQLQNWAERADLGQYATDLIALAESWLNARVPLRVMWVDTTLTGSLGSRLLTLPADYYEPDSLFLTTFGVRTQLQGMLIGTVELGTANGVPRRWGINGTNIELDIPCNQAHTFSFRYRKSFALSTGTPTNFLLTNHPDLYLAAGLVELYGLAKEGPDTDKELAKWTARRDSIADTIAEKEARALGLGTAQLVTELPVNPSVYNIVSDE